MDIRQMRYFMEICRLGSISQAADSLFISQQGLSSAVRRLEKELGCDLFYRKGNSLVMTENGKYFLENASEIVRSFNNLQNHYRNAGQNASQISLLCAYSILSKGPPALQKALLGEHPDINLSIGECYSAECFNSLENNECNFAICYEQDWCSQFDVHYLFRVEHCFVAHVTHPLAQYNEITMNQLDRIRAIFPEKKTAIWDKLTSLCRTHHIHPDVVFQTNQALQISNLITQDHSLVARLTFDDALAINTPDLKILRIKDADFSTRALLVHRRDISLTPAEQQFQQMILDFI